MSWTEEEYEAYMAKQVKPQQNEASKKKSKYNNNRAKVDGIWFDSQKEAEYYGMLKQLLKAKAIKGFCRQCEFILQEGFADIRPITYKADFIVFHEGKTEIIDVKGFEIEEFKLKKKMFMDKFRGLELKIEKE